MRAACTPYQSATRAMPPTRASWAAGKMFVFVGQRRRVWLVHEARGVVGEAQLRCAPGQCPSQLKLNKDFFCCQRMAFLVFHRSTAACGFLSGYVALRKRTRRTVHSRDQSRPRGLWCLKQVVWPHAIGGTAGVTLYRADSGRSCDVSFRFAGESEHDDSATVEQ